MSGASSLVNQEKQRLTELKARRTGLQQQAEQGQDVAYPLLEVKEEILDCLDRLKQLQPRHRVSYRTSWAGVADHKFDQMEHQTWAQLEQAGDSQELTTYQKMAASLAEARQSAGLTVKQTVYLEATQDGTMAKDVAERLGLDKSTVSRTIKRGKARLTNEAQLRYLGKAETADGVLCLDLSQPDQLKPILACLTERQQLYMTLYYGDWMSLSEISALLEVDKSTVLRTIRRGLEKLDGLLCGTPVELAGVEVLEEMIIQGFHLPEAETAPKPKRQATGDYQYDKQQRIPPAVDLGQTRAELLTVAGGGRLAEWIRTLPKKEPGWLGRRLVAVLRWLKKRLLRKGA